jgi:glycosyltransferase involved in cell wall biosynthesis
MKILVLMKRFGTNKDLVIENFGRQVRLFEELKKLGYEIDFLCMDYKKLESFAITEKGITYYVEPFSIWKFGFFLKKLNFLLNQKKYNVLVASTSPILGLIGYRFAKKRKMKFVYELQDAFDIYDEYRMPFICAIDRAIMKNSDLVVCVSQTLKKRIEKFRTKPVYVVENGVETSLFKPLVKAACRKKLRLPIDSKIIVYVGHISKIKGFDVLLEAFDKVRREYANCYLLISGKIDNDISIKHENVIYKDLQKRKEVVYAINSADLAVIPNPKNSFTEYCFPYKLVEYMACGVPIVATDVGDVSLLLKRYDGSLCRSSDPTDMADKMITKLRENGRTNYSKDLQRFTWGSLGKRLNNILKE